MIWSTLLVACGQAELPQEPSIELAPISARGARASLDLRGQRPSLEELERLESDPQALDELLDQWMADPMFEQRVMDLFAESFRTRNDAYSGYGVTWSTESRALGMQAIGQEPLRILGHVAANDLPWTDIVTADWTMANPALAEIYPLDYPKGGSGWQQARYTDARPSAGVLHTNGMWWRYGSTVENYNRGRANAVSRILLCNDFLERPVSFPRSSVVLDNQALLDQTRQDTACIGCHSGLDPLGSYFYGFYYYDSFFVSPDYNVVAEREWRTYTDIAPGYFGEPADGLHELGWQIAQDPRFVECAVETVYSQLLARDITLLDSDALSEHREAFLASGLNLKALIRSILSDPNYTAGQDAQGAVPAKLVSIELYAHQVQALTGYRWTQEDYDMLTTSQLGVQLLAGGADGVDVIRPAHGPNATRVLVVERLSELAAFYALDHDEQRPESEQLFALVSPDSPGESATRRAQLAQWQARFVSEPVSEQSPAIDELSELWDAVYQDSSDPGLAWAAALAMLMRDPAFSTY